MTLNQEVKKDLVNFKPDWSEINGTTSLQLTGALPLVDGGIDFTDTALLNAGYQKIISGVASELENFVANNGLDINNANNWTIETKELIRLRYESLCSGMALPMKQLVFAGLIAMIGWFVSCTPKSDNNITPEVVTPVDPYASNKYFIVKDPGGGIPTATVVRYTANGIVTAFVDKATFDPNTLSPEAFAIFLDSYNKARGDWPNLPVITSIDELKQHLSSGELDLYRHHTISTSKGGVSYMFKEVEKINFEAQTFEIDFNKKFINSFDGKEYPMSFFGQEVVVGGEKRLVLNPNVWGQMALIVSKRLTADSSLPKVLIRMNVDQDPKEVLTTSSGN